MISWWGGVASSELPGRLFKTLIESFALHIPDRFLCVKAEISPYLQAKEVNLPQVHIHF